MKEESFNFCDQISKYVIVKDNRIFIDICKRGCGSGCAYCYVLHNKEPQTLLSQDQIELICKTIKENIECRDKIISLCPNTEPLKSSESIKMVLFIINYFIPLGCFIQVSTKEKITNSFLREINKISNNRIYINISIPYLFNSDNIEPYAAPINERLDNFNRIKLYYNLNSCLYIKPFQLKNNLEQQRYLDIINLYEITTVCVGVKFDIKTSDIPCISLHNKDLAHKLMDAQFVNINNFVTLLRNKTNAQVFGSSLCCIYKDSFSKCILNLFDYNESICQDCNIWRQK